MARGHGEIQLCLCHGNTFLEIVVRPLCNTCGAAEIGTKPSGFHRPIVDRLDSRIIRYTTRLPIGSATCLGPLACFAASG